MKGIFSYLISTQPPSANTSREWAHEGQSARARIKHKLRYVGQSAKPSSAMMRQALRLGSCIIGSILLCSCGLFDSDVMWRGGPYVFMWIDTVDNSTVSYELDEGTSIGRIDATVYAVGWDGRYLVAKQHPSGNKSITNFFYIDSRRDAKYAEPSEVVVGPMTAAEFQAKAVELDLPGFSKTIGALE